METTLDSPRSKIEAQLNILRQHVLAGTVPPSVNSNELSGVIKGMEFAIFLIEANREG